MTSTAHTAQPGLRLAVAPASLGENSFRVTVTDQAGQPVVTQLVRLSFAMREMDMGEQVNIDDDYEIEPDDSEIVRRLGAK
mgnify:CR=1 FL=1